MQDLTPVVADDEKAVQNTKSERWDGEKVHRSNGLAMASEERQPSLHREERARLGCGPEHLSVFAKE